MADYKQIALQRKLAAAELIGDTEQVGRIQQRLAALVSVPVVKEAPSRPKAKPRAAPIKRAAAKEPAVVKKAAAPGKSRKRSEPNPAADVVFTPAVEKEE